MGRSNDYKKSPECLFIPDLKVPKKYLSILTGERDVMSQFRTPLSIQFQSICTTDVNGSIHKLKSKDSDPFKVTFDDEVVTLKVNPNKSDLITIVLRWQPVVIFHKIQRLEDQDARTHLLCVFKNGLDLSLTEDPLDATHFLTLNSDPEIDTALRICVLRGIPIVKLEFVAFVETHLNDVSEWAESVPLEFLLDTEYARPNLKRSRLLEGKTIFICFDSGSHINVEEVILWLGCLSPLRLEIIDAESAETENKLKELSQTQEELFIMYLGTNLLLLPYISVLGNHNSVCDLWKSTVTITTSNLKVVAALELNFSSNDLKRALEVEPKSSRLAQRKRRRKVERVSETDFFQFSSSAAATQTKTSGISQSGELVDSQLFSSAEPTQEISKPATIVSTKKPSELNDSGNRNENVQDSQKRLFSNIEISSDPLELSDNLVVSDVVSKVNKDESHQALTLKRIKLNQKVDTSNVANKSNKVTAGKMQVSFAEAVKSTKLMAEQGVKDEIYEGDPIEDGLQNLVIVEEIALMRRSNPTFNLETDNQQYKGRKNFKAFRKTGQPQASRRQYLQLYDEGSQIVVKQVAQTSADSHIVHDLAGEIGSVKGYQPESQPLFVAEDDEIEKPEGFQFLNGNMTKEITESEDDSDDDGVRFKFST